jgi:hypothetical protein
MLCIHARGNLGSTSGRPRAHFNSICAVSSEDTCLTQPPRKGSDPFVGETIPCGSPKFKTAARSSFFADLVDFATVKAPSLNKIQQSSTSRQQTFQQDRLESTRFHKFQQALAPGSGPGAGGSNRPARLLFPEADIALSVSRPHCAVEALSDFPDNCRLAIRDPHDTFVVRDATRCKLRLGYARKPCKLSSS